MTAARKMPIQKPGRSKQTYETPRELLDAVHKRFGFKHFDYDLAANFSNSKATLYFDEKIDSLTQNWASLKGNLWLNPPFGRIEPWALKCANSTFPWRLSPTNRIFFLVPASVGSEWFAKHCWRRSLVLALRGRVTYVGETTPYPKDNILCVYGERAGFDVWDWRK